MAILIIGHEKTLSELYTKRDHCLQQGHTIPPDSKDLALKFLESFMIGKIICLRMVPIWYQVEFIVAALDDHVPTFGVAGVLIGCLSLAIQDKWVGTIFQENFGGGFGRFKVYLFEAFQRLNHFLRLFLFIIFPS